MTEITIPVKNVVLSLLYAPVDSPKGLVQIIHGMIEHKERYVDFIRYLNERGFAVVIADHRGHGKSVSSHHPLGHIGSVEEMVNDEYAVTRFVKEKHPGLPLYLFGHSMGSLIARQYVMVHDGELEKVILCGTVAYNPGAFLAAALAKAKKPMGYSRLLWAMSNGLSFQEDLSWLSYNRANVEAYARDPLCAFRFTNYSNHTLFSMVRDLSRVKDYRFQNPKLKILSLSGKDDRTTGGTKTLEKTLDFLKQVGYEVTFREYDHMKHEILLEDDREKVYRDAAAFLEA